MPYPAAHAPAQPTERAPDTMEARLLACAACHGRQGEGTKNDYFPRLAGKPAGYLMNLRKRTELRGRAKCGSTDSCPLQGSSSEIRGTSAVRPSRRPLRGLLRMRNFLISSESCLILRSVLRTRLKGRTTVMQLFD